MGRRHDEERTRQNSSRQYPGGYDRHGYDERGYDRRGYPERNLFGPYYDREGHLFYEDRQGYRHYEERSPAPYERRASVRGERQTTGGAAIKWLSIVVVSLIVVVGMVMATNNLTGGSSESAQQTPQEQPQPVQQPQAPQPDAASSEQVEGLRADVERQLAEIRQSINELRLQIMSWWASDEARENSS